MIRRNPLLTTALGLTGAVAVWGIVDTEGLTALATLLVDLQFASRAWFIMASVTFMVVVSIVVAASRHGRIRLGRDDERPEFSTVSWLSMLFSAGMGVGLLFWATAEPLSHFLLVRDSGRPDPANAALFLTNFHWGIHAWAIYGLTGLVIAYFSYRLGCPSLVSAPIVRVCGDGRTSRTVGWLSDLVAIVAIAIGVGGSVAMGVFQVQAGVESLLGLAPTGLPLALGIFALLVVACGPPLLVGLDRGMALLSKTAMGIAGGLLVYILLFGPTHFLMQGVLESVGDYVTLVLPHGLRTYTFMDEHVDGWFRAWTLTFMVWWVAWAPFVGLFIARISRGRTIREFIVGVMLVPTAFSIVWFGVFGGIGFHGIREGVPVLEVVERDVDATMFFVLDQFPVPTITTAAVVLAAFLFVVTSVVSASFVLGMFSTGGGLNPSRVVKLSWGAILGGLGLVMILSGGIDAVKAMVALGALPFIYVMLLLVVCFLKALRDERPAPPADPGPPPVQSADGPEAGDG